MSAASGKAVRSWLGLALLLCLPLLLHGQPPASDPNPAAETEDIVLPRSVPDPFEPLNRTVWAFNTTLMTRVIKPTSKAYRFIVVKPVRNGIGNFGRNLTYPGRLINNLLQGRWTGARDESYRFFVNTTVGVAGVFDVGTKWNLPKSDADFGQTFGQWGWQPQAFIMLPILGPSNDRDLVGFAADTAANPLLYIAPYDFEADNPLTWLGPYTYLAYAVMYNNLADTVDEYVRFNQSQMDPYSEVQFAWTFARSSRVADFEVKGEPDEASLQTLQAVFFTFEDPKFPDRGRTRSVLIPRTNRRLKFTYWLQPGRAPVVYIMPGLGAHRLDKPSLALAELVFQQGYSAVCVSSVFNAEFMESAATAALPAYLPVDGRELHEALSELDRRLERLHPGRLGGKALLGYSLGALHSLFIAAHEPAGSWPLLKFDRYVALHTPVRLLHGVSQLDEFYRAPLAWPAGGRLENIENTFLKVAALSQHELAPGTALPFSAIESQFLIGLRFRFLLRDIIFSSQRRKNQGILQQPLRNLRRDPVYQEILQFSFRDYFDQFAIPYYANEGVAAPVADTLEKGNDLRTYEAGLRRNPNIRVIVNRNDFLLTDDDLAWLDATVPPAHLTIFEAGGHMGNLSDPLMQQAIVEALTGLTPASLDPEHTNEPPQP